MPHEIRFEPFGRRIQAENGQTLFEAAVNNGILLRSDCAENGTCGQCRVMVDRPDHLTPRTQVEQKALQDMDDTHRLACQAKIAGPLVVTVPDRLLLRNEVFGKTSIQGPFPADPAVKRYLVPASLLQPAPAAKDSKDPPVLSQSDKICRALQGSFPDPVSFRYDPVLKQLSRPDVHGKDLTVVARENKKIISLKKGLDPTSLGLAFDMGTTTIAAYLTDLGTGEVLASRAAVNPQRRFGEDVISRIAAISQNKRLLKAQQTLAATAMNDLAASLLETTGKDKDHIDDITIVGNTTMEHIIAGLDPSSLGVFPYLPVHRGPIMTHARDLGLDFAPAAAVYIFPVISGFLGGDILAAFLADPARQGNETVLIIDIGTNGELLLYSPDKIWATSCATGPALEGAQISCGMRAATGAVSKAWVAHGQLQVETIGHGTPAGICGSGIIDVMAALRRLGIVLENGNFNPDSPGVRSNENGVGQAFTLPGSDIDILLKDIRQVQLAKAALLVGIESIIHKSGVDRIHRTVLTGAFGARFDRQKAMDIGMLPTTLSSGLIQSAENLAGTGAIMALLDKKKRKEMESFAGKICFLDLSTEPDFVTKFSQATRFPALA